MMYLLFFFMLLCSCNFKPTYCRPELPLPGAWRFEPKNNEDYVNCEWWEQFGDPVLNQLIETSLENNQDLQVAVQRILEFYARYQVVASQLLPQLALNGGIETIKSSETLRFQPPNPTIPRTNSVYQLVLNLLSYEVDFWGRIRNLSESAKYEYFAQIQSMHTVLVSLVSSVATSYVQLRQFDVQLEISRNTYLSRKESWDFAQNRFDAGLVSLMEVKQAESQAQDAEVAMKNFETLIAQTEDLISILMGEPPHAIPRGELLSELKLPPQIPAGLPSDLIENRPDILEAEQRLISANAQIGAARAAYLPTISLTGINGFRTTDLHRLLKEPSHVIDYSAGFSQPLFTGGRITGNLEEAKAIYEENVHTYLQTILTALKEVEDALIGYEQAKEKLEIQTLQIAALQKYLDLSKLRYDNGQNDYLTVLNAETSLFQVQLQEVNTQADQFLNLINLYKALGQGWD